MKLLHLTFRFGLMQAVHENKNLDEKDSLCDIFGYKLFE